MKRCLTLSVALISAMLVSAVLFSGCSAKESPVFKLISLIQQEKNDEAIALAEKLTEKSPDNTQAHRFLLTAAVAKNEGDRYKKKYAELAKAEPFNGSGVNPSILTTATTPVLGSMWDVSLDCTGWSPSVGAVFGYTQPAAVPIGLAIGEVLFNPASAQQILQTLPHGGGVALFSFNIPADPSICGGELFMQGACFGSPGTQLTNRLDLRAGN